MHGAGAGTTKGGQEREGSILPDYNNEYMVMMRMVVMAGWGLGQIPPEAGRVVTLCASYLATLTFIHTQRIILRGGRH